jgi:hypothetical protein
MLPPIIATFVIAAMMYRYVEQPFRQRDHDAPPLLPTTFARWSGVAAILLTAVGTSATFQGWVWRLGDRSEFYRAAVYGGDECQHQCDTTPGRPVSIYLIGDSHARQYFAGFKASFPSLNTRIYHFSSCPFFSLEYTRDFRNYDNRKLFEDGCRASRRSAFEEIKNTRALVIISQFWVNFPLVSEWTSQRLTPTDADATTTLVGDQIAELKRELGIGRLALFGSVPGMVEGIGSPADCAARPISTPRNCVTSRRAQGRQAERATMNDLLAAKVSTSAAFLNPFDALCDRTDCKMIADGKPIYDDETHLTKWGSELVVKSVRDRLDDALEKGVDSPDRATSRSSGLN